MKEQVPSANWINVVGRKSSLRRMIDAWLELTDADELRGTEPLAIMPWPAEDEVEERIAIGQISHAPEIGQTLLEHLTVKTEEVLGLTEEDVVFSPGFWSKPA